MHIQRYSQALNAFDHAIRLDSNSALAYHNKGMVLTELGRFNEAISALNNAIRLEPIAVAGKVEPCDRLQKGV